MRWCTVVYPDGREVRLLPPGPTGDPDQAFRRHKFEMIHGSGAASSSRQRAANPVSAQASPPQSPDADGNRTEWGLMTNTGLTLELRDEIAHHLSGLGGRRGMVFRDRVGGLDSEQIASRQGTNVANVEAHIRSIERMLSGALPSTPSTALKEARAYNFLLDRDLSPALHTYVVGCFDHLRALNPAVQLGPRQPGATRDVRARRSSATQETCPTCGLTHAGECL